jgi:hypothetical protein
MNFHQSRKNLPMRWLRFSLLLLLPILACSALLLTGAWAQQTTPAAKSAPPAKTSAPAQPPDSAGSKTLDKAIDQLNPDKLGWLETTLWQHIKVQGLAFKVHGQYLSGPGHRVRMDLTVDIGSSSSRLLIVSDGKTVWDVTSIGKKEKTVGKWDLKAAEEILGAPGSSPQVAEQFYSSRSLFGIWPLLQNLRKQMQITKQEAVRWKNREAYKLTANWIPDIARNLTIQGPWPASAPRVCYLFLDKESLWPMRLEWWGPVQLNGPDKVLMEMEFRDPKITKPDAQPPPGFEQAFTYVPPKDVTVGDLDQLVTGQIRQMLMSAQARQNPPPRQ